MRRLMVALMVLAVSLGPSVALASDEDAPATGTFSPAGPLGEPRFGHTATRLPDGRVLVVGGVTVDDPDVGPVLDVVTAAVWDPATASFSPAGSLIEARSGHAATLLADGRVLVVGGSQLDDCKGYCWHYVVDAEVWDPETASFNPAGTPVYERENHSATLLPDGRVLVVGGTGDTKVASAEVWDPETASFDAAGSLATARNDHTATLLPDGRVLILGGRDGGSVNDNVAPAEVWDPESASFGPAGSLAYTRDGYPVTGYTATPLPDGGFLIVGGGYVADYDSADERYEVVASVAVWDPETASLDAAGSLVEGRQDHSATLLPDGRVLIVGGHSGFGADHHLLTPAEVWDPVTATFVPAGSLTEGRRDHTATLLDDGRVLVLGGIGSEGGFRQSAEVWEPSEG